MCLCYLFSAKNCMTTSESKGRFFTKRIDSHNESNRIDLNRELECSKRYWSQHAVMGRYILTSGPAAANPPQRHAAAA